jgi:hypothetical protein
MSEQSRIDVETDAIKLLATVIKNREVIWTAMIFADHLRWEVVRVNNAVTWLKKRELVTHALGSFVPTSTGYELHEDAVMNPQYTPSTRAWKDEALTGITAGGKRSEIENGAIPRPESHEPKKDGTPDDILLAKEDEKRTAILEKKAAQILGIPLREFRKLVKQKRIKQCRGWDGNEHLGRFHKNGKGLRHLCVECSKKVRK